MKTLVYASFAICVLIGLVSAQLPSVSVENATQHNNGVVRDGFTLSKGQVLVTRDGKTEVVQQEFVLTDGTHLFPNGDIILYTGARKHLEGNQVLTLDGMIINTPVLPQGVAPVYPPGAKKGDVGISSRDGITVSGTDALITRNGVTEKIGNKFELSGGVMVNPDGTFTKNGKTLTLRENQILGFDGVVRDARIHDTAPTAPANASPERKR